MDAYLDKPEALEQLSELTTFHSLECLQGFPVARIRHLHVMGRDEHAFNVGFYVDPESEWMLLINGSESLIQSLLSWCGSGLEYLDISSEHHFNCIDLRENVGIRNLDVYSYGDGLHLKGLDKVLMLERLCLYRVNIGDSLDVSVMKNLKTLHLSYMPGDGETPRQIEGFHELRHLEELSLLFTDAQGELCLDRLEKLKKLVILSGDFHISLNCSLPALNEVSLDFSTNKNIDFVQKLPNVETISIGYLPVPRIPSFENLYRLRELCLDDIKMDSLEEVALPASLEKLSLEGMPIRRLPEQIRNLKNLKSLDLSYMNLEELPDWLPELGLEFTREWNRNGICLRDTQIQGIDMSIFDQPQEMILKWFEERKNSSGPRPLHELKVVFLGDGEAGKTLSIARLLRDGEYPVEFNGTATPGIEIQDKEYMLESGSRVRVHFWDFGGQEIMHSMHRMFLTGRTLYVVLINARDDTQDDRARYWLHNIKNFADGSPVLLVLNKIDQNPNASVNERGLRSLYPQLSEVIRMSALTDSPESFRSNFTAALLRQIQNFEYLETPFHSSWSKLKNKLESMEDSYIQGAEYIQYCEECGVDTQIVQKSLLKWFNDLGVSFFYGDPNSVSLEDYVILRPNWITNAIYIVLFNRSDDTRNGIISMTSIRNMLCPSVGERERFRRVRETEEYSPMDTEYVIKVLEQFRLCYLLDEEHVFIPMLCQRNSLPVVEEYANDAMIVEFELEYEYLPNNVLHRLMVERRQELDMEQVWLTGARFKLHNAQLSALVKCEDRMLKLYVRAEDPRYSAGAYLSILLSHIARINESLNLVAPQKRIVYKDEGGIESFDYDMLIGNLSCGITACYSRRRRGLIPIRQILGEVGFRADTMRAQMRQKLLMACLHMTGNKLYWKQTEEIRCNYLRDMLKMEDWQVWDQSRSGRSAGELDLVIRRDDQSTSFICEAINLGSGDRRDAAALIWNLKKLAQHVALPQVDGFFLVCFVDSTADQFDRVYGKYVDSMLQMAQEGFASVIEDQILDGAEINRNRIRLAQFHYQNMQIPELNVIFVRFGQ